MQQEIQNQNSGVTLSILLPIDSVSNLEFCGEFLESLDLEQSFEIICFSSVATQRLIELGQEHAFFILKVDPDQDIQALATEALQSARGANFLVLPPAAPELWDEILQSYLQNQPLGLNLYQPKIKNFAFFRKITEQLTGKKIALDAGISLPSKDSQLLRDAIENECFSLNFALSGRATTRVTLQGELARPNKKRVYLEESYRSTLGKFLPFSFLLYCIVAGSGVIVNLGTLQIAKMLNLGDQLALVIAIEISMATNFVLHNLWTFNKIRLRGSAIFWGYVKFHMINLIGGGINISVALTVKEQFGLHIVVSSFIGILLAMIWNYNFNKKITWKSTH
ncbi:MAG: GtrA family protein [SAR324 cluster bacterium]|nr:GtrA family protein [SAR324 cluster bacterium]